jgi:subtilisin-like proprotein convertase family protein
MLPIALAMGVLAAVAGMTLTGARALGSTPEAPPGCVSHESTFASGGGAILAAFAGTPNLPATTTFAVPVSGMGSSLYHLALTTGVESEHSGELSITLTPPAASGGAAITVRANSVNDEGKPVGPTEEANVFNGTRWEDTAAEPAAKTAFTDDVTASPLEPDQAFARLAGIDPNGEWTLTITSYRTNGYGTLSKWSLAVGTCQSAPATGTDSKSNDAAVAIPHPGSASSAISIAGLPCYLQSATVTSVLANNSAQAVDMTLTSPQGEAVALTNGNGAADAAEVFNGTTWEDAAPTRVTSAVLAGGVTASPLEPEQGLARLAGEDPNGTWTLTVRDGANDTATLNGWALDLKTVAGGSCPAPTQTTPTSGGSSTTPSSGSSTTTPEGSSTTTAGGSSGTTSSKDLTPPLPPSITGLTLTPTRFRAVDRTGAHRKLGGGGRVSFTLSAAAKVRLTVEALDSGVKVGSRCVVKTRRRHGRVCTLMSPLAGSLTVAGHSGSNSAAFSGELGGHALGAGRYRLLATIPASPRSKPAQASFSIL